MATHKIHQKPLPVLSHSTSLHNLGYETLSRQALRHEDELDKCKKVLASRENEITHLKTALHEWKKKASELEKARAAAVHRLEERERFIAVHHEATLEAMSKASTIQVNETLDALLKVQEENKRLKEQLEQSASTQQENSQSTPTLLDNDCDNLFTEAERAHATAANNILYGGKKAAAMISSIHNTVNAIQDELEKCSTIDTRTDNDANESKESNMDDTTSISTCEQSSVSTSVSDKSSPTQDSHSKRIARQRSQITEQFSKVKIAQFLRNSKGRSMQIQPFNSFKSQNRTSANEPEVTPSVSSSSNHPSRLWHHYQVAKEKAPGIIAKRHSHMPLQSRKPSSSTSEQWKMTTRRSQVPAY